MVAAIELAIPTVILDDLAARKTAETMLLEPIGTLGILLAAKKANLLNQVTPLLKELIQNDFRISQKLIHSFLSIAGELNEE